MSRKHFMLTNDIARQRAIQAVREAPDGLEVTVGKPRKVRSLDQNAAMWAGPLRDIAEQAFIAGRRYDEETWHEYFKRAYLPEDDDPSLPELVKNPETYRKWKFLPDGERVLDGSTTELTRRGFHEYVMQIEAKGADLGVQFSASPRMAA